MIKIVKIEDEGGACPYQVNARTDDDRPVYVRYRHGHGRVEVGKPGGVWTGRDEIIFEWDSEDEYDGYLTYSELRELTKHIIEWCDYPEAQENFE